MTRGMLYLLTKTARLAPSVKHQELLDTHFTTEDKKKWRTFKRALRSKKFVDAVQQDERADDKLKRYAEMLNKHQKGKGPSFSVSGQSGVYTVKFHPDIDRFTCSCPDWSYTKSHKTDKANCKHITAVKLDLQRDGVMLEKTANLLRGVVNLYGASRKTEAENDKSQKAAIVANAYRSQMGNQFSQE